jgi:hypothetical protein
MQPCKEPENSGGFLSSCSNYLCEWWAVLGSNQLPLPCETEVGCLQINDMRVEFPIATGTCYHVMSRDITQCHFRSVPKMSHTRDWQGLLMTRLQPVVTGGFRVFKALSAGLVRHATTVARPIQQLSLCLAR